MSTNPGIVNNLTLGRPVFDLSALSPDTDPALMEILANMQAALIGLGWPSGAEKGDTAYQGVYVRDNAGQWDLYAGKPSDPLNPDLIASNVAGGGGSIDVEDEGALVGTFQKLNFKGAAVEVTDAGSGVADIDIDGTGGGGGGDYAIRGLNPDGGHSWLVVGTTLTLTLKAIDHVSVDGVVTDTPVDVEIVYTGGEECVEEPEE